MKNYHFLDKFTGYLQSFTISLNVSIIFCSKFWKDENTENDKEADSTADFL